MSTDIRRLREEVRELETELSRLKGSLSEVASLVNSSLTLTRRLTGDENLDRGIAKMQRAITIANQLRLTMIALQTVSGPVGWATLGISGLMTVLNIADLAVEFE